MIDNETIEKILKIIIRILFWVVVVMVSLFVFVITMPPSNVIKTPANTKTPYNEIYSVIEHKPDYTYLTAVEVATGKHYDLSDEEKRMVATVAWNADHTDEESLACVVKVILNRLESPKFEPDTIAGILKQKGQFERCDKILYDKVLYDYEAVLIIIDQVCNGFDPFNGECALFYANKDVPKSRIAKNLYLVKIAGDTAFYGQG